MSCRAITLDQKPKSFQKLYPNYKFSFEKEVKGRCKQCGHLNSLHAPYWNGKGWHCRVDNCSNWNLCKKPKG